MSILLTRCFPSDGRKTTVGKLQILVVSIARQIFNFQRSDFFGTAVRRRRKSTSRGMSTFGFFSYFTFSGPLPYGRGSEKTENMVGLDRLELSTSPLSGVRSSHLSYRPGYFTVKPATGGAGRDRTGDLLNANQALSQLSYSPKKLIEANWMQDSRFQTDCHSNHFNEL
jgi:hypothetical protein